MRNDENMTRNEGMHFIRVVGRNLPRTFIKTAPRATFCLSLVDVSRHMPASSKPIFVMCKPHDSPFNAFKLKKE